MNVHKKENIWIESFINNQESPGSFLKAKAITETILLGAVALRARRRLFYDSKKIKILSKYANQYAAAGNKTLIDQLRGGNIYRTGNWQGYREDLQVKQITLWIYPLFTAWIACARAFGFIGGSLYYIPFRAAKDSWWNMTPRGIWTLKDLPPNLSSISINSVSRFFIGLSPRWIQNKFDFIIQENTPRTPGSFSELGDTPKTPGSFSELGDITIYNIKLLH